MLLKDNKKGMATLIIKRLNGYEDSKPGYSAKEDIKSVEGPEKEYSHGYDACCDDMINAFKTGDSNRLKNSLKSFISMVMDEEKPEMD